MIPVPASPDAIIPFRPRPRPALEPGAYLAGTRIVQQWHLHLAARAATLKCRTYAIVQALQANPDAEARLADELATINADLDALLAEQASYIQALGWILGTHDAPPLLTGSDLDEFAKRHGINQAQEPH
jgi:hypothetical protein